MRIFDFDHAIVREPGASVVNGIRSDPQAVPEYQSICKEHAAYVAALRGAGLCIEVLPPLEQYPDSVFVEDPALVFPEGAILLRPGALARRGESQEIRSALDRHFQQVLELESDELVDGGDVLVTPDAVWIGLSSRTSHAGANALLDKLEQLGRRARIVATPEGILHFKTGASLLDSDTVLTTARMAQSGIFDGYRSLVVPAPEEAGANALRINDVVFVGACCPRTAELIAKMGFRVETLAVTEIAKLDAGLSCMSLRWLAQGAPCAHPD